MMCKKVKFIVLQVFCFLWVSICNAHSYNGHNADLKKILFGSGQYDMSQKGKDSFNLLCEAAYITLDYFNGSNNSSESGSRFLSDLKANGVDKVPNSNEISFQGNKYHQNYTHFGWAKGYKGFDDKANWEVRKQLLISTVKKITNGKDKDRLKIDSFAALVYEIHIIGDHIGDSESTRYTRIRLVSEPGYRGQEVSPTSDGPFNNPTLYTYLLYHVQRLFRDQKDTFEYEQILSFLNRHKNEYYNYPETTVPYEKIQEMACQTRDALARYIPGLLYRDPLFYNAFYGN